MWTQEDELVAAKARIKELETKLAEAERDKTDMAAANVALLKLQAEAREQLVAKDSAIADLAETNKKLGDQCYVALQNIRKLESQLATERMEKLREENARLRKLVKRIEWGSVAASGCHIIKSCPMCQRPDYAGHLEGCTLQQALAASGGEVEEKND